MSVTVPGPPVEQLGPDAWRPAFDRDLLQRVRSLVERHEGELVYTRRLLHSRPEASRAEHETTATLRERLQAEGLHPHVLSVGTGLLCDIGDTGPIVALRADIDALVMQDAKDVPYRSLNDGACHGCGHDVHTAAVLGAGLVLRELIGSGHVRGRVRLVFEPAEEVLPGGALDVIADGGLDEVTGIFGIHCDPKLDTGQLGCRIGPITSASDPLAIHMTGPGGHTARPALTVNLADEVARVVRELPAAVQAATQGIAANPVHGEVRLVFGTIHTGSAANVIPAEADLTGSVRTPDPDVADALLQVVPRALADVLGTDVRPDGDDHRGSRNDGLHWHARLRPGVTPVVNDAAATESMARAAVALGGMDAVRDTEHSWGGDTFGWYLGLVPGCYARLGTHWPGRAGRLDLHRPTFDVDERAIPFATAALVLGAIDWLSQQA